MNDKIYILMLRDYDGFQTVGYFIDKSKVEECREYLNKTTPSYYGMKWNVVEYDFNKTDYVSLNKELDEKEKIKLKEKFEKEKQEAINKIEELKQKYNLS